MFFYLLETYSEFWFKFGKISETHSRTTRCDDHPCLVYHSATPLNNISIIHIHYLSFNSTSFYLLHLVSLAVSISMKNFLSHQHIRLSVTPPFPDSRTFFYQWTRKSRKEIVSRPEAGTLSGRGFFFYDNRFRNECFSSADAIAVKGNITFFAKN